MFARTAVRILRPSIARHALPSAARVAGLLLLVCALAGCQRSADVAPLAEPYPLTLPDPAVLGYAVARLQPDELRHELTADIGFCPDGLADDAPLVLVRLDSDSFGGPLGVILPVADERAFLGSLERAPVLQSLGEGSFRLVLPEESRLAVLLRIAGALQSGGPMALLQSIGNSAAPVYTLQVEVQDGRALVVPSFEALSVCRRFVAATGGFAHAPPFDLVVSCDIARLRTVYAQQLRDAEDRLRGLLSGAQSLGMLGAIAAAGRGGSPRGALPINWELVWALKSMLDLGAVEAVQFQLGIDHEAAHAAGVWSVAATPADPSAEDPDPGADADVPDTDGELHDLLQVNSLAKLLAVVPRGALRVQLGEHSALLPVAATLAPAPEVEGARVTLAANAAEFARKFAAWCRPLGEVVKGAGPPCDRYLDELATLASGWGGLATLIPQSDGSWAALATLADRPGADAAAWRHWLEPLLASAHVEGFGGALATEARADGSQVLRDAAGGVVATVGRRGTVGWLRFADVGSVPDELCERLLRAQAGAADAPALRLEGPAGSLGLASSGRELSLRWAAVPGG